MMFRFAPLLLGLLLQPAAAVTFDQHEQPAPRLHSPALEADSHWALRVGAFPSRDSAEQLLTQLRQLGQAPRLVRTRCEGDSTLYNVVLGDFAQRRQAEAAPAWRALPGFSMRLVRVPPASVDALQKLDPADCPRRLLPPTEPDDDTPDDRYGLTLFGRPLEVGGDYTFSSSLRKDRRLDSESEDDQWLSSHKIEFEALYEPSDNVSMYLEFAARYRQDIYAEDDDTDTSSSFERGETWVFWRDIGDSGFGLQAGRINIQETREWWWEEDLDGIRLYHRDKRTELSLVLAQELAAVSTLDDGVAPEDEDVLRLIASWEWEYIDDHSLALFGLAQDDRSTTETEGTVIDAADEDEIDTQALWLGARLIGRWRGDDWGRLYYWADFAWLHGRETVIDFDNIRGDDLHRVADGQEKIDLRGSAYDLGLIWQTPWLDKSWLALGYAEGSGDDDPDDDTDNSFRQTGLNDNSQRLRGEARFSYYGEMFRPELSNMRILTAALGMEIAKDTSIDLVWHEYSQVVPAEDIRDTRLSGDADEPNGIDRDLGREIDIIFGRAWKGVDLDVAFGYFEAGKALRVTDSSDRRDLDLRHAWILSLELEYEF